MKERLVITVSAKSECAPGWKQLEALVKDGYEATVLYSGEMVVFQLTRPRDLAGVREAHEIIEGLCREYARAVDARELPGHPIGSGKRWSRALDLLRRVIAEAPSAPAAGGA
jgi:hypothetical protein